MFYDLYRGLFPTIGVTTKVRACPEWKCWVQLVWTRRTMSLDVVENFCLEQNGWPWCMGGAKWAVDAG